MRNRRSTPLRFVLLLAAIALLAAVSRAAASDTLGGRRGELRLLPPVSETIDAPLFRGPAPVDADGYRLHHARPQALTLAARHHQPTPDTRHPTPDNQHPCPALADEKPLAALGISIALPAGELPTDHAAPCWQHINQTAGPFAAMRLWPMFVYQWDAVSFCHKPLYFEEINLERYGYGCCDCLQPLVSAAHFFGTVPALPYCMTANHPHECIYALGHYRPGSCPPRRCHWPPCDAQAAAVQAGVLTGMIFLIP